MLETNIREQLTRKEILLMTHIVIGYPTIEDSLRIVEAMVAAGVDLIELQIPFSEPIADGPVILHANQLSLAGGSTVERCTEFAGRVAGQFDIPFLFMSYYNILFRYGEERFAGMMAKNGLQGAIVPDLPPEEGQSYVKAMGKHSLAPVFIYSPSTSEDRMRHIAANGRGFIYCVARKGVTGKQTSFSGELDLYLQRCRKSTNLPLALGFGVKDKADVDFLKGKVDIAVIGTQTIRLVDEKGVGAVEDFISGLR